MSTCGRTVYIRDERPRTSRGRRPRATASAGATGDGVLEVPIQRARVREMRRELYRTRASDDGDGVGADDERDGSKGGDDEFKPLDRDLELGEA